MHTLNSWQVLIYQSSLQRSYKIFSFCQLHVSYCLFHKEHSILKQHHQNLCQSEFQFLYFIYQIHKIVRLNLQRTFSIQSKSQVEILTLRKVRLHLEFRCITFDSSRLMILSLRDARTTIKLLILQMSRFLSHHWMEKRVIDNRLKRKSSPYHCKEWLQ